ncbi:hypothetical protein Tco_0002967 [Tanacetum coccineum]
MDITLTLSPIDPLDVQFDTPSPPLPLFVFHLCDTFLKQLGDFMPTVALLSTEGLLRLSFAQRMEIARDTEINPFKDVLVFRRIVEFLGALPINLKRNMWESKDLIENSINWDKPPKDGDGAWHAKIRIIDLDGEEFTKTLQSIPTTRKLSERESPREIINLDHFYDT